MPSRAASAACRAFESSNSYARLPFSTGARIASRTARYSRVWKIARSCPRVHADGLIRFTSSEYGLSRALGSYVCVEASTASYAISRRSSSANSGTNQSGCSNRIPTGFSMRARTSRCRGYSRRRARRSGAPRRGRRRAAVALRPVVALVGDEAVVVEAQPREPGERDLAAVLEQRRPPFDRRSVAVDDRLPKGDLDVRLRGELPPHVRARLLRLAERMRPEHTALGVEGG